MPWVDDRSSVEATVHSIDKSIILTTKDSWFWKLLSWCLFIVTFSKIKRERFLVDFATTIGPVMAFPVTWTTQQVMFVCIHESRHIKQFRYFGLGIHPWVGVLPMALVYLLFPIPVGLAYFRYRLELDADQFAWKYYLKKGAYTNEDVRSRASSFAVTVSSSSYGWSWPKSLAIKGFIKKANQVIKGVNNV